MDECGISNEEPAKGDKGDTVLAIHFIRGDISRLIHDQQDGFRCKTCCSVLCINIYNYAWLQSSDKGIYYCSVIYVLLFSYLCNYAH